MVHWEQLTPGGLCFVYDDRHFRPGTDTVFLASMPRLKPGLQVCDLGCGTGLLSLLLLQRQPELSVVGVDIQREAVELAREAVERNGLHERFRPLHADLREIRQHFSAGSFDLVVCNPPYYPVGAGKTPESEAARLARSEEGCTLEDVCRAAAYLLSWSGAFCMVYKPERLTDLLCTLRKCAVEPKRLRFVASSPAAAPSLVLVEGRRGGKPGLFVEAPLLTESSEADAAYFRTQGNVEHIRTKEALL